MSEFSFTELTAEQFEGGFSPTWDWVFARVSQEAVMQYYLGLPVRFGHHRFTSPLREDTRPGCYFQWETSGKLEFKDWAWKAHDAVGVVQSRFRLNYNDALWRITNDFKLRGSSPVQFAPLRDTEEVKQHRRLTDYVTIAVKRRLFQKRELDFYSLPDWKATQDELNKHDLWALSDVWWNGEHWVQNKTGVIGHKLFHPDGWQIYRPFADRQYRFRASTTERVVGLNWLRKDDHLLITKSFKDCFYLRLAGFNACCVLSENKLFTEAEWSDLRRFSSNLILFYDNDETGRKWATQWANQEKISYIELPKEWGKDYTDLCKEQGLSVARDWLESSIYG
ncbi:hypothetical protein GCM10028806_33420 [Spirosoma terrae]|uniref:Toprim domain-containing protein n=1 Tax=Spirosoma terrae TaxID=1968276 RepID=A0A6L9L851_9BACT|nr:hypothetical protein [Spirosoma terrae]NDU95657.1 hypothetical protein [Spirosoma terrae]